VYDSQFLLGRSYRIPSMMLWDFFLIDLLRLRRSIIFQNGKFDD